MRQFIKTFFSPHFFVLGVRDRLRVAAFVLVVGECFEPLLYPENAVILYVVWVGGVWMHVAFTDAFEVAQRSSLVIVIRWGA